MSYINKALVDAAVATWVNRISDPDANALAGSSAVSLHSVRPVLDRRVPLIAGSNLPNRSLRSFFPASTIAQNKWEIWDMANTANMTLDGSNGIEEIIGLNNRVPLNQNGGALNPPLLTTATRGHACASFESANVEGLMWDTTRLAPVAGQDVFAFTVMENPPSRPEPSVYIQVVAAGGNLVHFIRPSAQTSPCVFFSQANPALNNTFFFPQAGLDDAEYDGKIVIIATLQRDLDPSPSQVDVWMGAQKVGSMISTTTMLRTACSHTLGCNHVGSGGHLTGKIYQGGWMTGNSGDFTDEVIGNILASLCDRYGVPTIDPNMPLYAGRVDGPVTTSMSNDAAYWFRRNEGLASNGATWDSNPLLTALSRQMNDIDGSAAPTVIKGAAGGLGAEFVSTSSEGLRDATPYTWSESATLPAATGYSAMTIFRLADVPIEPSGHMSDMIGIQLRRTAATNKMQCRVAQRSIDSTADLNDVYAICIGTYDFTEKVARSYFNGVLEATQVSTITGLGVTRPNVGQLDAGVIYGDGIVLEFASWKHKLTDYQIDFLLEYARDWYDAPFL